MKTQPILAFDCATHGGSVALRHAGKTVSRHIANHQQAALLVSTIDELLRENNLHYRDLGRIITTVGPGSFTGIRIGLAALRGFVLAYTIPITLLTTLEAIAWQVASDTEMPEHFTVTLGAGKGELYAQDFKKNGGSPNSIGTITLVPENKTDWQYAPIQSIPAPAAEAMCQAAEHLPTTSLAHAVPLYIRPPDATLPSLAKR